MKPSKPPEARRAELTTAESDLLLSALNDGFLRQRGGRVVAANAALGRLAGLPPQALIGRTVSELLAEPGGRPLRGPGYAGAACVRDDTGQLRPVSLVPIGEELLLLIDRGRERRLEQEVWRLSRRPAQASTEDLLHGEVAGMIEHEIRTSVTVVRGYLRMLLSEQHGALNPEQWRFGQEARRATDRVLTLLDNLLDLAKGGEALPVVRKPARAGDVLEAALETARPLIDDAGLEVELDLAAEDDRLLADPQRLEQVFVNLISNTAMHAPAGSRLRIASSLVQLDSSDMLAISFSDEGPGVCEADAERIFGPFVQGHGSTGVASGGVGLGLFICRRIVEAHEGSIDAVPALGFGLFRVMLPLHRASDR